MSSQKFFKSGDEYRLIDESFLNIHDTLPVGTYTVEWDKQRNEFFLKTLDDFKLPEKMYGDITPKADRIFRTFLKRPLSTGMLAVGEKGSGKTLLTKLLSVKGLKEGMPTIVISSEWHGDIFNRFIQNINQPAIILFDEFEKVYSREKQEMILTLLDGVFPTKKLFLFTANNKFRISEHMTNRPGRIFYYMEYEGLDSKFIEEYCEDNLIGLEFIPQICTIASTFDQFNFDMLASLVEEMNRYDESPYESLKMLNAHPSKDKGGQYELEVTVGGKKVRSGIDYLNNNNIQGNPVSMGTLDLYYEIDVPKEDEDDDGKEIENVQVPQSALQKIEPSIGRFTYVYNDLTIVLTRVLSDKFSYDLLAKAHAF